MQEGLTTQRAARLGERGAPAVENWRALLRRELGWILLLKLAGLALIWALFFRA
ncbi:MAG TPA: hypothetical protein VMU40_17855 [Steroidobacteraceae bacterium]|nr:hypothetical protein [Steroidobacteraceae bacterium]